MKFFKCFVLMLLVAGVCHAQDARPTPIKLYKPDYPDKLKKEGVQGVVVVDFIVGTDGKVVSAKAVESPDPRLSELAEKAILKGKFNPGLKEGVPVAVKIRQAITFVIHSTAPDAKE